MLVIDDFNPFVFLDKENFKENPLKELIKHQEVLELKSKTGSELLELLEKEITENGFERDLTTPSGFALRSYVPTVCLTFNSAVKMIKSVRIVSQIFGTLNTQ